jgi:hypothetical protein
VSRAFNIGGGRGGGAMSVEALRLLCFSLLWLVGGLSSLSLPLPPFGVLSTIVV